MRLRSGQRIGDYDVVDTLGVGGYGEVYLVRHRPTEDLYALKAVWYPSPTERERVLREGHAQATLVHENIVRVHRILQTRDGIALVMDVVRGPPLDQVVVACRPTLDQRDLLARQILGAVAHAHRSGVIHRDLKPGNVLLDRRRGRVSARVTDFGLVKRLDDTQGPTFTGTAVGTPCYMAPEQIRNAKAVDARADVFSLGVLLYELVTGNRPFHGTDAVRLCADATHERYRPIGEVAPEIPERMKRAITAAMRGDRDLRPIDAGALMALWVDGTPAPNLGREGWAEVVAGMGRIELPMIPSKPTRRQRWGPAVAAAGGLGMALFIIGAPLGLAGALFLGSEALPDPEPTIGPAPPPQTEAPPEIEPPPSEPPPAPAAPGPSETAVRTASEQPRVDVRGFRAEWVRGGQRVPDDQPLKPGTWELWVAFDQELERVGSFEITLGERRSIECIREMLHCRWGE